MKRTGMVIAAIVLLFSGSLSGATLRVPSQYATIQAAVDGCMNNDTILVASGNYCDDHAVIGDKMNIIIMSEAGRDSTLLPNGSFGFCSCNGCIIKGFTIPWGVIYGSSDCIMADCDFGSISVHNGNYPDNNIESYNISIIGNRIHESPFDSTYVSGTAVGGYTPNPTKPSIRPMTLVPSGTIDRNMPDYTLRGPIPVSGKISGSVFPVYISEYCWRPTISGIVITPDTTNCIIHWHTDSASTHWIKYGGYPFGWHNTIEHGNATSHADTILLLEPGYSYNVILHNCRFLDRSCCEDSVAVGFTTNCSAMSSPRNVAITKDGDSLKMTFDSRATTSSLGRWRVSADPSWTTNLISAGADSGMVPPEGDDYIVLFEGSHVSPYKTYYLSIKGYNDCSEETAWCDSFTIHTDGDGNLSETIVCPTVAKSGIVTQALKSPTPKFHFHTDYATLARYRVRRKVDPFWNATFYPAVNVDSLEHTSDSYSGLPYTADCIWESSVSYDGCEWTDWADSTAFVISCPKEGKTGIATQNITKTGAVLHFHTAYGRHSGFRYHATGNNPWVYRHDADADSIQHTITIAGLDSAGTYVWETNSKYSTCDSTAYGDSTQFTNDCQAVTVNTPTTPAITSTGGIMNFTTDLAVQGYYRHSLYTPDNWTYHNDTDADSTGHSHTLVSLTPNHIRYKWESATVRDGCAITAYGNTTDFYTACDAITMTDKVACVTGGADELEVNSGSRVCKVQFRYRKTSEPETWVTLDLEATVASGCHVGYETAGLSNSTGYTWEYRYLDECGTTSDWIAGGTNTTDGSGHWTGTCNCGEA